MPKTDGRIEKTIGRIKGMINIIKYKKQLQNCKNMKEVREYFDETGADISGMSKEELEQADEVFKLPDGRYLVVDA